MGTIAERLNEAMLERGVDQSALARAIGVTQGSISLILLGKTRRSKHLPDIAQHLGVSLNWLMGFDERKHPDGPEQVLLGPQERELIEKYRQIGPVGQIALNAVLDGLLLRWAVQSKSVSLVTPSDPGEAALAQMFEGLLESIDQSLPPAKLAGELAQLLPIGLSAIQGRLSAAARPIEPQTVSAEARSNDNHEQP